MPGEVDSLGGDATSGSTAIFMVDCVNCDHESADFPAIVQHCLDVVPSECKSLTADQLHQVKIMCASGNEGARGFLSYLKHMHQGMWHREVTHRTTCLTVVQHSSFK